jgi:membrane protein DedA with SNARE-associated domain
MAFPVPPGTLLMAAAAFAAQGYFSFWKIVLFGTLGNIVGDNIAYFVSRKYGRTIFYKIGLRKMIESQKYKKIEERLRARPGFLIFITRFEVFSNLAVNIMCGLGNVPYKKYIIYDVLGEFAQVLLYASIGYLVGDAWQSVSGIVGKSLFIIITATLIVFVIFWKKAFRKSKID